MIKSMTGYGRGENTVSDRKCTVEIKSVNHRYNDISIKLPRSMNHLEERVRKTLRESILRGKTDVYVSFETFSAEDVRIDVNEALASAYVAGLSRLQEQFGLKSEDSLGIVARLSDVLVVSREQDGALLWEILQPALSDALSAFLAMRAKEGAALLLDIESKLEQIRALLTLLHERAPLVVAAHQEKMRVRLAELLEGVHMDEARLATEVAIFADKSCIDEELTRLESHLDQVSAILLAGGAVGRKLDFLIQELNREANTIASKANDLQVTTITIDLKSEIEKIREQVQNIE